MESLPFQLLVIAGLVIFTLNLILNLRSLKTPREEAGIPEPIPLVSILVPARDEEVNIAACIKSLQQQDYPNFEILVLDDNSSDNTADIVSSLAADDPRIRLLPGAPLPEGWAGKTFACYQLAREASGSWLLFVDADTTHEPHMLRSVLELAIAENTSLLSGFPRQLANSLVQKVAIPVLYFVILSWLPLWWLQRTSNPKPSLAIGQFLLFPSQAYWEFGGHAAVKGRILEDVWLGVEVKRRGRRHLAVNLSPVVSCHMYHDVGTMVEGFGKWIYSVAALSPAALLGMAGAGYIFYLAPFYWLWNGLFVMDFTGTLRIIIIAQIGIILFMRWLVDSHFKEPFISVFLHPLGFAFLLFTCVYAGSRRVAGAGVRWKKRLYDRGSYVE